MNKVLLLCAILCTFGAMIVFAADSPVGADAEEIARLIAEMPDGHIDPAGYLDWKVRYMRAVRGGTETSHDLEELLWTTGNGYVAAKVSETAGEFDEGGDPLGGGSYVKLTFSWPSTPGTEWTMYYVDGYSEKTSESLPSTSSNFMRGDTVFSIWNNWHGVYIRQEIVPVSLGSTPGLSEQIRFKAVMKPADGACHNVGAMVYYDTMLDSNDGAPIATAFGYTGYSEMFFLSDTVRGIPPIWHAYETSFPPAVGDIVATGILRGYEVVTPPDVFWYGPWPGSHTEDWDDPAWAAYVGDSFGWDTATMVKWYPRNICEGDSVIFVTYYGIGYVEDVFRSDLYISPLDATCSDVVPNPIPFSLTMQNGTMLDIHNLVAFIDLTGTGLRYVGGDPNPATFTRIGGFGGSQVANWQIEALPEAFGTTQCFEVIIVSAEDSIAVTDTYCVDIPEVHSISATVGASDFVVHPTTTVGLTSEVHWELGEDILMYHWTSTPASSISDPHSHTPTAVIETTTTFVLSVSDTTDCVGIDSVTVHMQYLQSGLFTPEANCDGRNVVEICYTLRGDPGTIEVIASTDAGSTWNAPITTFENATNDLGAHIQAGTHCFDWIASTDLPNYEADNFRIKVKLTGLASSPEYVEIINMLDTKPPVISAICPPDTVIYGDTISLDWLLTDLHDAATTPGKVYVDYCAGVDSFTISSPIRWSPEPVVCDRALLIVSMPDSFCNWGIDTCEFSIASAGSIMVAFPETIAAACETLDVPIVILEKYLPLALRMSIDFSINSSIIHPIEFRSALRPAISSAVLTGADTRWRIDINWATRGFITSDTVGYVKFVLDCGAMGGDFSPLKIDAISTDLMTTSWENGLIAVDYDPQPWMQVLTFTDLSGVKRDKTLAFGNSPTARDLYDATYDIVHVTPPPSEIAVWFELNDADNPTLRRLQRSIQDMNPVNVWKAVIGEASGLYVHWNPYAFDEGIYSLNGLLDMRADTDYYAAPGETLTITWTLPGFENSSISLVRGWNLVSIPVHSPSGSPNSIFPGVLAGPYGIDAFSSSFFYAERVEPGQGYWVFSLDDVILPVVGVRVDSYSRPVARGWNLIGATATAQPLTALSIPGGVIISHFGYETGAFVVPTMLQPGKGYLIFTNIPAGVLSLPAE